MSKAEAVSPLWRSRRSRSGTSVGDLVHRGGVLIALEIMLAGSAAAQDRMQDRLAHAQTLSCQFLTVATAEWSGQAGAAVAQIKPAKLLIRFDKINADEGTAQIADTLGTFEITARLTVGA